MKECKLLTDIRAKRHKTGPMCILSSPQHIPMQIIPVIRFTLYCSPNIVRVIKSRRMRWAGHVAHMGEERGCIGSWWGNQRERDHWGDLGVDGWIILGLISRRWDVGIWTGLGWPRTGTGGGRL